MEKIWILILFRFSDCIRYFNRESYLSFEPPDRYKSSESLFGFSIIFLKDEKKFYVGAPKSKKDDSDAITGAVFQCSLDSKQCLKYFKIPDDHYYTVENTKKRKPLFGMTLVQTNPNAIIVCAPNIVSYEGDSNHCNSYFIINGNINRRSGLVRASQCIFYTKCSNYGINLIFSERNTGNILIIGNKIYYRKQSNVYKKAYSYLVEIDSNRNEKDIPTVENSLPSYTILFYPKENHIIYMVITYYMSNNLLGSFEVKTKTDFPTHQNIHMDQGSPGQYFGFSGTFANFNKDNCFDLAISAPFYSNYMDEGRVYIFFCNEETNRYEIVPLILSGDMEASSRFGISLTKIGDRHNDGIDNIAVLAPFWYSKSPVIYIYSSNKERLNPDYADRIVVESEPNSVSLLSYGLLSEFKVSSLDYFDLLIQFPNNNMVKLLSVVEFVKLKIIPSTEVLHEMPNPLKSCYMIEESLECYFTSKYIVESCVNISNINDISRLSNDRIILKHSLHDSPGGYIFESKLVKETKHSSEIFINTCFQDEILFLYTPASISPMIIKTEAYIEHVISPACNGLCSDSDSIISYYEISSPFSQCDSVNCVPDLQITDISIDGNFQQGMVSRIRLDFKLVNHGSIISYTFELIIKCPSWIDIASILFDKIEDKEIVRKIENSDDFSNYIYSINHLTNILDPIDSIIDLEIRAPLGTDLANIEIKIQDPMYRFKEIVGLPIKLSCDDFIPLRISGASIPPMISIGMYSNQRTNNASIYLDYFFEIQNLAVSEPMEEVFLEISITNSIEDIKFLKFKKMEFADDFNEEACLDLVKDDCSKWKFSLQAKYLSPQSLRKFYLGYIIKHSISKLVNHQLDKLDVISKVCFRAVGIIICKELKFYTNLFYLHESHELTTIWPIILSVIMSCLILIVIVSILIKTRWLKRFKDSKNDT